MRPFLLAVMTSLVLMACSSSGDEPASNPTTSAGVVEGSASSDVEEFCAQTRALGEELRATVEDPEADSADTIDLARRANDLLARTPELNSAHPDEVALINECALELSVSPG